MAVTPEMASEGLFEDLLSEALQSPDIRNTLTEAGVSEEDLRAEVQGLRAEILREVAPELDAYGAAVHDLEEVSPEIEKAGPAPAPEPEAVERPTAKSARRGVGGPSVDEIIASSQREEAEPEIHARQAELDATGARARQLLSGALAEELRSALNRRYRERKPALQTEFRLQGAEGLAQVVDQRLEVPTQAAEELAELLRRMKGGSVGVSGPRGAGKTTLLRRFCEGREAVGSKGLLAVLVPAPVAYDSREFVVHLFAELCVKAGAERPPVEPRDEQEATTWHWPAAAGRFVLAFLTVLGALGALAGLAGLLVSVQSAIGRQPIWGATLVLAGATLLLLVRPVTRWWLTDERTPLPVIFFLARLLRNAGIAFCLGGAALIVTDVFGESASSTAIRAGALLLGAMAIILAAVSVLRRFPAEMSSPAQSKWPPTDSLANLASRMLEEIRYQQTYTRGWSGALALPAGLQAGVSADTSLARHTMTYPEVIGEFGKLLSLAAQRHDVVIGIDELDKLESGQKADQFLNELKAVFGVPGTYFLVSVSEDAMSRFERRGLPIRDVFDSTFDEIVHVRPLKLGETQTLLDKRVVGLPVIFAGLCHVLSGGLPRDLIRTARRLVEVSEREGRSNELEALTKALLADELRAKIEAVRFAARTGTPLEPQLTNFLDWLDRLAEAGADSGLLIAFCEQIDKLATSVLPISNLDSDERAARSKLLRMGLELGAYGYFAATVLDVFRNDLSEEEIREAADGQRDAPGLEGLARAHSRFVVNPNTAWLCISSFRSGGAIDPVLDLPPQAIA